MPTIQPADESALPTIRLADQGALPTIRLGEWRSGYARPAALLGVVSATAGLGVAGWIAGLATGSAATALLVTARMRSDQPAIHPADWVTLTRAVLIAGVAGLVADSFRPAVLRPQRWSPCPPSRWPSTRCAVGRCGRYAHRHPLGAAIDGEVDAFLILLLSIYVSQQLRQLGAGHRRRPLRAAASGLADPVAGRAVATPERQGRSQGIVLTVAASGVVDRRTGMIAVAAALLLLAESFGRNVIWLYRTALACAPAGQCGSPSPGLRSCSSGVLSSRPTVTPGDPGRLCPHPLGGAGPGRRRGGAVGPPRHRGSRRWNPVRPARARQDPQHSVLLGDRAAVQRGARLGRHLPGHWRDTRRHRRPVPPTSRSSRSGSVSSSIIGAITASAIHITTVAARHRRATVRSARRSHSGLGAGREPVTATCPWMPLTPRPVTPDWSSHRCATPRDCSATSAVSNSFSTAPTPKPVSPGRTC